MPKYEISFFGSSKWKGFEAKTMKDAKEKFAKSEGVGVSKYIRGRKPKGGSSY